MSLTSMVSSRRLGVDEILSSGFNPGFLFSAFFEFDSSSELEMQMPETDTQCRQKNDWEFGTNLNSR